MQRADHTAHGLDHIKDFESQISFFYNFFYLKVIM